MSEPIKEHKILELLSSPKSRQEGFVALMEQYREPLYWHVRRMVVCHEDAQDVLQECFIKVHRHLDSFHGDSSLKTWIYRIATNEAIRLLKKNKIPTDSYDEKSLMLQRFESEENIDFVSLEAKLQRAILSLPPKQQIVFNLRYYEEMSYEQIAEVTESSVATLKTNYHFASTKIKRELLVQIEETDI